MSSLKRKMEIEKIKKLIFEMINEDGLYPDADTLYQNQSYTDAKKIKTNSFDINDRKNKDVIAKSPPDSVLNTVKELENKVKIMAAIKGFNKFLKEMEIKEKIQADISSIDENSNIRSIIENYEKNAKSKIPAYGHILNAIESLANSIVIDLLLLDLPSTPVKNKPGGPLGNAEFVISFTDKNTILDLDLSGNSVYSKSILKQKEGMIKQIRETTENIFVELGDGDWWGAATAFWYEMRGKSIDSANGWITALNDMQTVGLIDLFEGNSPMTKREDSIIKKIWIEATYGMWVLTDAADLIVTLLTGGTGVGIMALTAAERLGVITSQIFGRVYAASWAFLAGYQGTVSIKEWSTINATLKTLSSIIETIVEKIYKEVYSDSNLKILSPDTGKGATLYGLESRIKKSIANVESAVTVDSMLVEAANIAKKYRSVVGEFALYKDEAISDPSNPAYKYRDLHKSYIEQQARDYRSIASGAKTGDIAMQRAIASTPPPQTKKLSSKDLKIASHLNSDYDANTLDILNVKFDESDLMSPRQAELFVKTFPSEIKTLDGGTEFSPIVKDKEGKVILKLESKDVFAQSKTSLEIFVKVLIRAIVKEVGHQHAASDLALNHAGYYINGVKSKINDNQVTIFEDKVYQEWENKVKDNSFLLRYFIENNNKFSCKVKKNKQEE